MISTVELVAWTKAVAGEETILRSLEKAAVDYVNRMTGRWFGVTATIIDTFRWRGGTLLLANEPTTLVLTESEDGVTWATVAASRYVQTGRLVYLSGSYLSTGTHIRATYTAGYAVVGGDADVWNAPEAVKQAVRMLVGHWYVNREAAVVGTISSEVELGVRMILQAV